MFLISKRTLIFLFILLMTPGKEAAVTPSTKSGSGKRRSTSPLRSLATSVLNETRSSSSNESSANDESSPSTQTPEDERRARRAEQQRERRARETDEQRERRRAADADAHRQARATETQEEADHRRQVNTNARRRALATETQEEAEHRREVNTNARRRALAAETQEEADHRRQVNTNRRRRALAAETPVETKRRRTADAAAHREAVAAETPEESERRRGAHAAVQSQTRSNYTPQQRAAQSAQRRTDYQRRMDNRRSITSHIAYQDVIPDEHYLGPMDKECASCGALYFEGEGTPDRDGTYEKCCNHGHVVVPLFNDYPGVMQRLLDRTHPYASNFHDNIRQFNSSLAMASMDSQVFTNLLEIIVLQTNSPAGRGPYVYRIHGSIHHNIGPAMPQNGRSRSYGQLYFIDTAQAICEREGNSANSNCNPWMLRFLSNFLPRINPLCQAYKMMGDVYREQERRAIAISSPMPKVKMVFKVDKSKDQRRYNLPSASVNEVAVVFVGPDGGVPAPRQYTVHERGVGLTKMNLTNPLLDPLTYPIFWPKGTPTWHENLEKINVGNRKQTRVTMSDFYSFLLSIRRCFNPIHYGGKLLQQFVVDLWVRIECNKLKYIRDNQKKIRAELYQTLRDFVDDGNGGLAGTRVVLPATHTGSPRYYAQAYRDTMSMVAKFGKPDLFLTFTCNPHWREIQENLKPGQAAHDRPDLIARVFALKWKALLNDIVKNNIFGKVISYAYTIEFQKRGLPHAHLLITLAADDKPDWPDIVDCLISAEIPELHEGQPPETTPPTPPSPQRRLYNIVKTNMIHRKCGATDPTASCMKDGACSKKFPKNFRRETCMDGHGYPEYRRRNNGFKVLSGKELYDNRHVVPYNKYILAKYNCHINLEICCLIHACKYLYKYVFKGCDKATVEIRREARAANGGAVDEIEEHLDARYLCAPEAIFRIFENKIQDRSHSIDHLQVHLPEQQRVSFEPGKEREALNAAAAHHTILTGFFALNKKWDDNEMENRQRPTPVILGPVDPRGLLYTEIPISFVWTKPKEGGNLFWKNRQTTVKPKIGRLHAVSIKDMERFALRQLLLKRKGPRSFEDLRTVNGQVFPSFEAAALFLGLLNSQNAFIETMDEACITCMPSQLRSLFASLFAFFSPDTVKAQELWEKYAVDLSEDYGRRGRRSAIEAAALAWYDIADMVGVANIDFEKFIPPPLPHRPSEDDDDDPVDHVALGAEMRSKMNAEQENAVAQILSGNVNLAFVDGPGGCGKTFVYETIYHILKGEGKSVICAAWTGIAASLLPEGRTICSLFKLNSTDDNRTSSIKPNSRDGALLRSLDTIIIDEVSMLSTWNLEAINKCLQDVCNNTLPFGGKRVLMGGDFRQVLPIPPKNSGIEPHQICLKNSELFPLFTKFELKMNMRASSATTHWKQHLMDVGNGTAPVDADGFIEIPQEIVSDGDLIGEIFDGVFDDPEHIQGRAILSPRNRRVDAINNNILDLMSGEERTYYSFDQQELESDTDTLEVSQEFMHEQSPSGFPPHELRLKIGCVVMLLRNLNIRAGLCNGTRLQVTKFGRNIIEAAFISGPRKGEKVLIPRIDMLTDKQLSFKMRRTQFPLKLAFAMSINKAQGQSLDKVGIDLEDDVFGHGMTYVALSRGKSMEGVKVLTKDKSRKIINIVDQRVLT